MNHPGSVPDAWDDDWVTKADSSTKTTSPPPSNKKLSKAERRARQAEFNRQLWEDAEAPKDSYFLNSRDDVPLKTEFKPAVKVLSRKPTPATAGAIGSTRSPQLNVDDDDDDDDENDSGKTVMSLEERQQKALLEREEKQKKYEEARQRLFGSGSMSDKSGECETLIPSQQNGGLRGQSKGRGGRDARPSSSTRSKARQLFDPNYSAKSDSAYVQRQDNLPKSGSSTPIEQKVIRNPRGPEKIGKGGFGFAPRETGT